MHQFFRLKLQRNIRAISHWGIHPIIGIPVLVILFFGASHYLFQQSEYAIYIYGVLAILFVFPLGGVARNSFLKLIFSNTEFLKVRIIENALTVIPFVFYLLFEQQFIVAILSFLLVVLMALAPSHQTYVPSLKTPFWRWPFEFSVGFRILFWLYPLSFFIVYKAIEVGNMNLGIFGMEVVFIISIFYYFSPEPPFYVWIHQMNSSTFLIRKIGVAILYSSFIAIPIALVLAYFFPDNGVSIFTFLSVGYGYLITVVLAKYASYPKAISLPQGLILGMSLYYPVIIIGVIPILYFYTNKRLKLLLHDSN